MTQSPDNHVRDVLHRQSARSMGYRKVYVEPLYADDPSPEAKRRRILRVAAPAAIAALITFVLVASLIFGVGKWMQAMVAAERNINEIAKQQAQQRLEEERRKPVTVTIDAGAVQVAPTETEKEKK